MRKIVVGIATYHRNALLERCLDSLSRALLPECSAVVFAICDNSAEAVAHSLVEEFSRRSERAFSYLHCPERGISQARNTIIEFCLRERADLIAFIDDDEFVDSGWMVALLGAMDRYAADAVQGPVFPCFERDVSGVNFSPVRSVTRPEGVSMRSLATNNVLFKSDLVLVQRLRFDPVFSLTGGGDYDFFLRSHILGNCHIWTNEAVVYETVPALRQGRYYKLKRTFRVRAAIARSDSMRIGFSAAAKHLIFAFRDIVLGFLYAAISPISIFGGRDRFVRWAGRALGLLVKGVARIAGLLGLNIRMYR